MEIDKINKKINMVIFFLAALFLAISPGHLLGNPQDQEKPGDDSAKSKEAGTPAQFPGIIVRPKTEFKGEGLRDPFKDYFQEIAGSGEAGAEGAPPLPEEKLPSLKVQGVICGGRISQAIINDEIVEIGDTIEGARVTNIGKNGVTVFFGHKSYNISSPAVEILKDLEKKPKGGNDDEE